MTTKKPWVSGFCNTSNPPDSHQRCKGHRLAPSGAIACACVCHTTPPASATPATEPTTGAPRLGVYDALDEAAYHSDPTSISASGMKTLLKSPAHFKHGLTHPQESAAMSLGTVAHTIILGTGPGYVAIEGNRNRNDVKAAIAAAEAQGKVVLKPEQLKAAERMADAVLSHKKAARLLASPGRSEVSVFARDPMHDVIRRCRWDRLGNNGIGVDLKTAHNVDPAALPKHIIDFGYDLSAAWYLDTSEWAELAVDAFALVFVESAEPHNVVVVELDDEFLERGAALAEKALRRHRECTDSGHWPGYADDDVLRLAPPRWSDTADQILLTIPEGTTAA
ncbi:PD-(D/E)XK nuclease-like domain-containing protein [Nocardioides jejuensis]|uniref:Putative exodeoxyribonuclease 8 PDDEXK-like domain-containing protein n=1 Tax=Nocardioides jejuensis TaxID=2502782 RepID=A0A4V2NXX9_9ACTN|nr:PD-(D/E)XK nuclease-like domain-containing protein [Nocardioides jejuensis]TCJ23042.1 hypothetical protein EPD65_11815 [Nocardioides jejuensis]